VLSYRDVKDENIIIDTDTDEVKLIDFGSGCGLRSDWYTHFSGTLLYAPPEWIREHRYSHYSGMLLYAPPEWIREHRYSHCSSTLLYAPPEWIRE
jgi:serine/threonine protein kinase